MPAFRTELTFPCCFLFGRKTLSERKFIRVLVGSEPATALSWLIVGTYELWKEKQFKNSHSNISKIKISFEFRNSFYKACNTPSELAIISWLWLH